MPRNFDVMELQPLAFSLLHSMAYARIRENVCLIIASGIDTVFVIH